MLICSKIHPPVFEISYSYIHKFANTGMDRQTDEWTLCLRPVEIGTISTLSRLHDGDSLMRTVWLETSDSLQCMNDKMCSDTVLC